MTLLNENTAGLSPSITLEKNTVLLIENDQRLSDLLQKQLYEHGYNVNKKQPDESILSSISKNKPFLVILDIGFSHLAVLKIITQIRDIFSGPLVLLTSRDSEQEQITAFNLGADEYLVKPVSKHILNVRVDALYRRSSQHLQRNDKKRFSLGNLTLFPNSYKCLLGDKDIPLTQFEFKLMQYLARNEGRIMSRDDIYKTLLGRGYNGVERTIDVRISQLRDKITKDSESKLHIETVWGQGYMLSIID
jgi:DNA-binding response OmpR family regulator